MDPRRSSLFIGSRTRRNVLKGKNIRKLDDGADNFADYWTDSNSEDSTSSVSDECTDLSQTQKEPQSPRTRLSTLHLRIKVKDKQGNAKFLNPPPKVVKKSIRDESIFDSPTKKQKLSSNLQQDVYHNSTQNVNNVSNSSAQSFVGKELCSISNSTFLLKSTESTDTSALPKIKKVKGSQISSSSILTSKNNNEEECIELNTAKHVVDALKEKVSPLLTKSKEGKGKISYSLRSSRSRNLNESTQLPETGDNDIMKCTENILSPLPKQNENRRKTIVINENDSNANLGASDTHMLTAGKVVNTEANLTNASGSEINPLVNKTSNDNRDTNLTNASGSEINPLVNKTSNDRNSLIMHKDDVSSSVENHTVKRMKNSLQMSEAFAVYDEYDAKIIQMAHNLVNSLNVPEKEILSHSRNVDVSLHNKKNNGVKSSFKEKFTRLSINSPTSRILRKRSYENQNKQHLTLNSSKILPKFTSKNGSETDFTTNNEIDIEASVFLGGVDACMSHVSEIQDKDVLGSNHSKKGRIDKVVDKLNPQNNNSENPEIVKQPTSPYNKQKKIVSKVKRNLKASETFSKDNVGNIIDTSEIENKNTVILGHRKGKHENKIHENLNASKTISNNNNYNNVTNISAKGNEIAENFDNEEEKHITKTNKKVSETFSIENIEHAADVSAGESESIQNLNSTKKKHASKIPKKSGASKTFRKENIKSVTDVHPTENEVSQNLDDEWEECTNNIHENLQASGTISTKDIANAVHILPKKNISKMIAVKRKKTVSSTTENEISQNLDDKSEEHANNAHEDLQASGAFSSNDAESAADIFSKEKVAQRIAIKRKKSASKISKNLKSSNILSKDAENIVPEINNGVTANFQDEKISRVKKNKEKQKASETFSKDNNSANEFLEAGSETTSVDTKRKKHVTESCVNLSAAENNNQLVVPSKKNKKKDEIVDKASVRRSVRQKFPPLAAWRNERILYRFEKDCINVIGIDKGTGEDVVTIRQRKKKEIKKKRVPKVSVHDVVSKKKVRIALVKKFDDVPWDKKHEACQYHIKRMFETESSVTGFIEIEPNAEKPIQYMPKEDVYLTVLKGEIEIHIQNDVILANKNAMCIIPRCVPYSLNNVTSRRALLAFCVGRFQYLEDNL